VGGGLRDELECVTWGIARSNRRTDAPLSARSRPAKGPGARISCGILPRGMKAGGGSNTWSQASEF
jgi:hypothetical protein